MGLCIHPSLPVSKQADALGSRVQAAPTATGLGLRTEVPETNNVVVFFSRNKNVNVMIKQKKITFTRAGEVAAGVKLPFNLISEAAQVPLKTTVVT